MPRAAGIASFRATSTVDARTAYLERILKQTKSVDVRIVLQMQRLVEPAINDIFVVPDAVQVDASAAAPKQLLDAKSQNSSPGEASDANPEDQGIDPPSTRGETKLLRATDTRRESSAELIRRTPLLVLLGDPGSGKSTLLRWISHNLARAQSGAELPDEPAFAPFHDPQWRQLLPVPIVLRYFSAWRQGAGKKVPPPEALERYLEDGHWALWEADGTPGAEGFGALALEALRSGRGLLLCDGLDEAISVANRQSVIVDLAGFRCGDARAPMVVSSRVLGYEQTPLRLGEETWRLEPFSPAQSREFFGRWSLLIERLEDRVTATDEAELPPADEYVRRRAQRRTDQLIDGLGLRADGERANDERQSRLAQLASNPLFSTLIGLIHQQGRKLPEDRAELYRLCLEAFVYDWEMQKRVRAEERLAISKDETVQILEQLAWVLHSGDDGTNTIAEGALLETARQFLEQERGESRDHAARKAGEWKQLVAERSTLLVERGDGRWGFGHLQFQEYLAGRALVRDLSGIKAALDSRVWQTRWLEPITLAASHLTAFNPRIAATLLDAILDATPPRPKLEAYAHHRLQLATGVAADTGRIHPQFATRLTDELCRVMENHAIAWLWPSFAGPGVLESLPSSHGERLLDRLFAAMHTEDSALADLAALTVSTFQSPLPIRRLAAELQAKNPLQVERAAEALGRSQQEAALEPLLAALHSPVLETQRVAAEALGDLALEAAVDPLLGLLQVESVALRRRAIVALGKIRSPRAIEPLKNLLEDGYTFTEADVSRALGRIGGEEVFRILQKRLGSPDAYVREAAVSALAEIGDARAALAAAACLGDPLHAVRYSAISTVKKHRDPRTLPQLLPMIRDPDDGIRRHAAFSLGKFPDPRSIGALTEALADKAGAVRSAASLALSELGAPVPMPILKALLSDPEHSVLAVYTLARMNPETVAPDLLAALKSDSDEMRSAAATSLGHPRNTRVVEPLLGALEDDAEEVRENAAESLGRIVSHLARPALLKQVADRVESIADLETHHELQTLVYALLVH